MQELTPIFLGGVKDDDLILLLQLAQYFDLIRRLGVELDEQERLFAGLVANLALDLLPLRVLPQGLGRSDQLSSERWNAESQSFLDVRADLPIIVSPCFTSGKVFQNGGQKLVLGYGSKSPGVTIVIRESLVT